MGFWEGIKIFLTTNVVWVAGLTILTAIATIMECSRKIKTPIQSLMQKIKQKKLDQYERERKREERAIKEERNIQFLVDNNMKLHEAMALMKSDIEILQKQQNEQQQAILVDEIDRIRWEILDFANSCRHKRTHTKNEFEHIIALSKKYDALLEKTGQDNGVFEVEYEYIIELYKACMRENSFLA